MMLECKSLIGLLDFCFLCTFWYSQNGIVVFLFGQPLFLLCLFKFGFNIDSVIKLLNLTVVA
jgi:hypothetical protein